MGPWMNTQNVLKINIKSPEFDNNSFIYTVCSFCKWW